ncbi:MAG TPA: carboxypeptidase regulatory-like domain-containing protein [Candidatus Atribacteria bacterium]|nr:carboxypeptidase regulatory-like domain-containing protein [Candidatus Atribacteria bacterium]
MNMTKIVIWIAFIFILITLSGCSIIRWQVKQVTFRVYIIQEDSEYYLPAVGAKIDISGSVYTTPTSTTSVSKTVYTNSNGEVTVNLQPGTYTLTISKAGYTSVQETITIYTLQTSGGAYNFYITEEETIQ